LPKIGLEATQGDAEIKTPQRLLICCLQAIGFKGGDMFVYWLPGKLV
jgi:hypothetical protein